ncbi:XRE family transcriptional regulator [Staphylococcus haemolyticus]|uniref:LexA family protein n=1 Tax=Staphylococcus sp. GDX7P459A TaxID=2608390 RepID=UPI0011A50B8C|nr:MULTISPECIES: XRE family transcriptional regulator [Staphylococcus]KAA2274714.1 helix-turn-helix domain-containing protein [Staphylococcus sp. GDX7P312P]KAA2278455.1 helix-turn-helix domain-containing protein [Staphylococcus sp. GDX7P459A]MCH4414498.1 XRE family transcriptional regulator [Staphylococcus haemolyticus]
MITIIKSAMKEQDMSLSELARRVGVAKSAVSRYLNLTREFPLNRSEDFAKALSISTEYLLGFDKSEQHEQPQLETLPVKKIPVVSKVSAGLPIYSEENLIDYIYFATNKLNSDKEEFGLKVSGDSMDKIFQDGDIVVVEKDSVVENGQLGVVMINGYNATVKRIRYNGDQIILIPESNNSSHYPQVYGKNDEVKIIGRVVASQKLF